MAEGQFGEWKIAAYNMRMLVTLLVLLASLNCLRVGAASIPHGIVFSQDGATIESCRELTKLTRQEASVFIYLATHDGRAVPAEFGCPKDMVIVEGSNCDRAIDAAVVDAAEQLAPFPRSSIIVADSRKLKFNVAAMTSILSSAAKSKTPTYMPVRFAGK